MRKMWNVKNLKRGIGLILCAMLLCPGFYSHAEEIKISNREYAVTLKDAERMFMSNDKAVSGKVGTKVFLTYTVEELTSHNAYQNGVIATKDNKQVYPIKAGELHFSNVNEDKTVLFEVGYTYVFRFEITEKGFKYQCGKLKGDEAVTIKFPEVAKEDATGNYKYFGTWFDCSQGNVSAVLNHVRCYDENGNDLGLHFNNFGGSTNDKLNELLDVHYTVNSSYSFDLNNEHSVAISNKYPTSSDRIYMEYEVSKVKMDKTYQQGLIASWRPQDMQPHSEENGYLLFYHYDVDAKDKPLLQEGAKYFICFERLEEKFEGTIQRTMNGKTETFTFPYEAFDYDQAYKYFSVWLGEGEAYPMTASFKNVKCYDADGNNLGIQLNKQNVSLSFRGESDDYSKTEAVYYCEAINGLMILQDKQKFTKQIGGVEEQGTYKIMNDSELYLSSEEGKETCDYNTLWITDENGHRYKRLKPSTVTFVTGDKNIVVQAEECNGYRVLEPEVPSKKGNTFEGWFLGDGTAFHFDTIVTESITLYAKWKDGEGHEYLAANSVHGQKTIHTGIAIAVSALLTAVSVTSCIVIAKRRKRNDIK